MGLGRKRKRKRKIRERRLEREDGDDKHSSRRLRIHKRSKVDGSDDEDSECDDYSSETSFDFETNYEESDHDDTLKLSLPPLPESSFLLPDAYEILAPNTGPQLNVPTTYFVSNTLDNEMAPSSIRPSSVAQSEVSSNKQVSKKRVVRKGTAPSSIVKPLAAAHGRSERTNGTSDSNEEEKAPSIQPPHSIIIDTSALVEEIYAGRYPSIKVFHGEHMKLCLICKEAGELLACHFCPNVEHLECLKTKVNVRNPGPDEEFMCHKCIQTSLSRRSRAERRRLQKLDEILGSQNEDDTHLINITSEQRRHRQIQDEHFSAQYEGDAFLTADASSLQRIDSNPAPESDRRDDVQKSTVNIETFNRSLRCPHGGPGGLICCEHCTSHYSNKLSKTGSELEAHLVSKIGIEVSELMELLSDAQSRLQQAVDASEANDMRRKLLKTDRV
jgi:hypothetical protein